MKKFYILRLRITLNMNISCIYIFLAMSSPRSPDSQHMETDGRAQNHEGGDSPRSTDSPRVSILPL